MRAIHPDEQRFIDLVGSEVSATVTDSTFLMKGEFRNELVRLTKSAPAPPDRPASKIEGYTLMPLAKLGISPVTAFALLAFIRRFPKEAQGVVDRTEAALLAREVKNRPYRAVARAAGDMGFTLQ